MSGNIQQTLFLMLIIVMQIAKCRYRSTGHQLKGANPQIVICPSNSVCTTVSTFCNNTAIYVHFCY